MKYLSSKNEKIKKIQTLFSPLIGRKFDGYEFAEIYIETENSWESWLDLPIYLCFGGEMISVSWNKFEDLGLSEGRIIPFSLVGSVVRWNSQALSNVNPQKGQSLVGVSLGRGQMSLKDKDIEIWTRLLLHLSGGATIDIYNALDENGISLVGSCNNSELAKCI